MEQTPREDDDCSACKKIPGFYATPWFTAFSKQATDAYSEPN
jgi:hypothetical protein